MVSQSGSSMPPTDDLLEGVMEVVTRSPVPTLILELPSERIIAASSAARDLLSPSGEDVVGRNPESFVADTSKVALELLIAGRLNGFEADLQLRLSDGSTVAVQVWVRAIGDAAPPRHALVVAMADGRPAGSAPCPLPKGISAVIGTTDANLAIERVSSDVAPLFGHKPAEIVGQPIFRIVQPADLAGLLWALAELISEGKGVALSVHINAASGDHLCQMLLSPLDPPPSFAFVLLPVEQSRGSPGADTEVSLWQMRRGIEAIGTSRDFARLTEAELPGLSALSSREFEIVTMLLAGDRVPAVSKALFISQSTVRNHLTSVFKKLQVHSQQELIDLLRAGKDTTPSQR